MPSVAKLLREEIVRISRQQFRGVGVKLRKSDASLRRAQSDLKRRLTQLESAVKLLARKAAVKEGSPRAGSDAEAADLRMTGNMVRSMRRRLGVSQENLAKLLNITAQSVYLWERKGGKLKLRASTARGLATVRKMTRTDAQAQLRARAPAEERSAKRRSARK